MLDVFHMSAKSKPDNEVGNMNEKLIIKMLGEFSISCRDHTVSDQNSRSRKLWMLLEYLVTFRDKVVAQSELIDLLWESEEDVENPANTLKTILYRVRALLDEIEYIDSKKIITYSRGSYAFNPDIPVEVDADEFERLYKESAAPGVTSENKIALLQKVEALYKGDFLPKSAHEPWVVPIATYYHSIYISTVMELCGLLSGKRRWDEILDITQRAVNIDTYIEEFHQYLIRALMETGQSQAALAHYDYVTNLFYTQLGISPSQELTALYKLVKQTNNELELDLNIIKSSLGEFENIEGAYFCEYEFFKDVYRLEARAGARNGQSVCIALLTVADTTGSKPTQKVLNNAMQMLSVAIQNSLRRGDVYTRYSVSQYLIMLSTVSFETATAVIERTIRRFKTEHPKSPARISYKLQPLEPVMK